jgi:WD40 repeat protein
MQTGIKRPIAGLAFSANNRLLFACAGDGKVHVWDVAQGKERRQFALDDAAEVMDAAFSPDGRWVAWAGREGGFHVHDLATGEKAFGIVGTASVSALAFSPDGRTLAAGGWYDPTIQLWEVATGQLRHSLRGHRGRIFTLVFSADGKRLASGSEDTTALLWDLTGQHAERSPRSGPPIRAAPGRTWHRLMPKPHIKRFRPWPRCRSRVWPSCRNSCGQSLVLIPGTSPS